MKSIENYFLWGRIIEKEENNKRDNNKNNKKNNNNIEKLNFPDEFLLYLKEIGFQNDKEKTFKYVYVFDKKFVMEIYLEYNEDNKKKDRNYLFTFVSVFRKDNKIFKEFKYNIKKGYRYDEKKKSIVILTAHTSYTNPLPYNKLYEGHGYIRQENNLDSERSINFLHKITLQNTSRYSLKDEFVEINKSNINPKIWSFSLIHLKELYIPHQKGEEFFNIFEPICINNIKYIVVPIIHNYAGKKISRLDVRNMYEFMSEILNLIALEICIFLSISEILNYTVDVIRNSLFRVRSLFFENLKKYIEIYESLKSSVFFSEIETIVFLSLVLFEKYKSSYIKIEKEILLNSITNLIDILYENKDVYDRLYNLLQIHQNIPMLFVAVLTLLITSLSILSYVSNYLYKLLVVILFVLITAYIVYIFLKTYGGLNDNIK